MLMIKIRLYRSYMKVRPISEESDCVTTKRARRARLTFLWLWVELKLSLLN